MASRQGRSEQNEGRWMRGGQVGFVVLLAALCVVPSAEGACLRIAGADGIGGTGLEEEDERIAGPDLFGEADAVIGAESGGEDDGIGGTGLTDLSAAQLDRYRGSGFTPDEAGASSMGIYGTITGLGSICLNGLRLVFPDGAVLERDSEGISPENLRVGHVVSVEAVNRLGAFTVERASLQPAIEGPVTGVDPGERALEVMGEQIELIPDAVVEEEDRHDVSLESLDIGDFVVVHGLRGSRGTLMASRVSRRAPSRDRAAVRGLLVAGARALRIGGVRIEALALPDEAGGQWVVANGRWNPGRQSLEEAQLELSPPIESGVERVSVEALVGGDAGNEIFAAGLDIEISDLAAEIVDELPAGTRLWLRGRILSDNRVEISTFRVAPAHLFTPLGPGEADERWWQEQRDLLPDVSELDVDRRSAPSVPLHAGQWTGRPVQAIRPGPILR